MEKIKNYKVSVALFVAGLVVAAGITVTAQSGGLETIKDAVIALTAKILQIETRVVALEENAKGDDAVGGVTAFDQLDVAWIETGDVASTTDGTWTASVRLEVTGNSGISDDFWRNDTDGDVWVTAQLYGRGVATGTMQVYVATSSVSSLTDYTYSGSIPSAAFGQSNNLAHAFVGTSTKSFSVGTSTPHLMLKKGEYVVLEKINKQASCAGGSTFLHVHGGHCASGTSTNFGMDFYSIVNVYGTTTPKQQSF